MRYVIGFAFLAAASVDTTCCAGPPQPCPATVTEVASSVVADNNNNQRGAVDSKAAAEVSSESSREANDSGGQQETAYSGHNPVWLEQGWSRDESQDFYFRDQGSELIPFDWFMALELAGSTELFRSDRHMSALGYITQPANSFNNRHALPIGFVQKEGKPEDTDIKIAAYGEEYEKDNYPKTSNWLGLTCAACHTADITYQGKVIRIDGGAAMADHESLLSELAAALRETSDDDAKFARFEQGVRQFGILDRDGGDTDDLTSLRAELKAFTGHLEQLVEMNAAGGDLRYGFGRLDAFGAILNEVTVGGLGISTNACPSDAPVSYPSLWYAPHLDFVQWNRSADNALARNLGEVLGVYAHFQLRGSRETMFRSTANFNGLLHLERLLEKLKAPEWPEEILGTFDADRVTLGAKLFAQNCQHCHAVRDADGNFPMTEPFGDENSQFIITTSNTPSSIKTDPKMILNFGTRMADPGALKPFLAAELQEQDKVLAAEILKAAVQQVLGRFAVEQGNQQPGDTDGIKAFLNGLGGNHPPKPECFKPDGYISRPLYGIWATAPYLHNGSVPNLYELLLPDQDRSGSFYVGSREFDPKRVGYVTTDPGESGFRFEAIDANGRPVLGNMNTGHSGPAKTQTKGDDGQWRDFTDEERWALVEYMKTLK